MNNLPNELEILIYKYLHEMYMFELKKEMFRNQKTSSTYMLKWKNILIKYYNIDIYSYNSFDFLHDFCQQEYKKILKDSNISCLYFKRKLEKEIKNYINL